MSGLSFATACALWGRYDADDVLDPLSDAAWNHARVEGIGPRERDQS